MTNIEKNITYSLTRNTESADKIREIDNWNIEHVRQKANQQ